MEMFCTIKLCVVNKYAVVQGLFHKPLYIRNPVIKEPGGDMERLGNPGFYWVIGANPLSGCWCTTRIGSNVAMGRFGILRCSKHFKHVVRQILRIKSLLNVGKYT